MKTNRRSRLKLLGFLAVLLFSGLIFRCSVQEKVSFQAPLFDNLGNYKLDITSKSPDASRFVNQGIIMANAFNHMEAARSLKEAVRLDSTCALAYWGLGYVLGPNYNTESNMGETAEIREAVRKAKLYGKDASDWEQALIDAIVAKFPEGKNEVDDQAYEKSMAKAYQNFPQNDLIVTLYAESLMNQHAWDLYTRKGGEAKPWTPEIVGTLEQALKLNPNNPLTNHLYIHATEAAPDVEKALKSAERLKTLVPGAGHLVHMPSHIYINTGDYHEGSVANEQAVIADSIYIAECKVEGVYPQMYYPHNYHFLAATAALEGRGGRAIEAAFKTADIIGRNYLREPGFETTQHYITIPYNTLVKFAQWEKILALPAPEDDLDYPKSVWHYARGMAYVNTGKVEAAEKELAKVVELAETDAVKNLMIWEINSSADIVNIAIEVLSGELKKSKGNFAEAVTHFQKAIEIEDQLNYNEPPDWFFSVRHILGDTYLRMKEFEKAEAVYREDLTYWVKNGFALNGLYHSLKGQGKTDEANQVKSQFDEAWKYADSDLKYSRINEDTRKDLKLTVREDDGNDLIYLAAAFCGLN